MVMWPGHTVASGREPFSFDEDTQEVKQLKRSIGCKRTFNERIFRLRLFKKLYGDLTMSNGGVGHTMGEEVFFAQ